MKIKKKLIENLKPNKLTRFILLPLFFITFVMYLSFIIYTFKNRGALDFTIAISITVIGLLFISYIATFVFDGFKKIPSHVVFYMSSVVVMLCALFDSSRADMSNTIVMISMVTFIGLAGFIVYQWVEKKTYRWYIKLPQYLLVVLSGSLVYILLIWTGQANELTENAFLTYQSDLEIHETKPINLFEKGVYGNKDYLEKYDESPGFESKTTSISYFLGKWSKTRERYLGFNVFDVPLNGQYFLPEGENLPLVLVVHGNHEMSRDSEIGYGYLGEYLSSRGYIVVSVDENFLNYSAFNSDLMQASLSNENDARAYVLLEHINYLLEQNNKKGSIFYNKIDKDNIALIGHSRGGEAVSIAGFFNEVNYLPNDYHKQFDNDFEIKSIVGIAPTDKQYKPGGRGATLTDVNYLLLHGAQDMDVSYMVGLNQYERINYTKEVSAFKAAVNIYGANHGYFNETWSKGDTAPISGLVHNTKQLLGRTIQENIASQLIYYFLEATINERDDYRDGFKNLSGFVDLPTTLYQTQYHDETCEVLVDFSEDNYLETGTGDVYIESHNLSKWYEGQSKLDGKTSEVFGAYIGVRSGNRASYDIIFEEDHDINLEDSIYLTVADYTKENKNLIDFSIKLEDVSGVSVEVPLSTYGMLQHRIDVNLSKLSFIEDVNNSETFLQTFQLPIEAFVSMDESLDLEAIKKISLVFNNKQETLIFLKDLGIRYVD